MKLLLQLPAYMLVCYTKLFYFYFTTYFCTRKNVKMVLLFPLERLPVYGGSACLSHHHAPIASSLCPTASFDSSLLIYVQYLLHIFAELVFEKN